MTQVQLDTTHGAIVLELDADKAPASVENFVAYVKDGHYDGTIFHRIIPGFMAQGGGFTPDMKQKSTNAPVQNEASNGLKNLHYTVAMARTPDPHSATSQFFINFSDNDFLDFTAPNPQGFGYTVFGKVVQGQDVVDKLATVRTGNKAGHSDVPVEDIVITKATLL